MELVLNTYGTSLSRNNERFVVVSDGNKKAIPTDGIKTILVSKGIQITSDAVLLAIENEIDILFVDKSGNPFGRVWSPKYGSISTIRKGQLNFVQSSEAVGWIKGVICRKIDNQQSLLYSFQANDERTANMVTRTVSRMEAYRSKVVAMEAATVYEAAPALRGWEGVCSKLYFEMLNEFIPREYRFEKRQQHPATDIANALLNYGYGMMYGKIEGAMIKAGIDPYIGVMHRDNYNRPVLVYDVIEIYRVWVDYVVYTILSHGGISNEYYSIREDGSCWLEQLGRRVLIQSLNEYLDEEVAINKLVRSRHTHIFLYAQNLAQYLKSFEKW